VGQGSIENPLRSIAHNRENVSVGNHCVSTFPFHAVRLINDFSATFAREKLADNLFDEEVLQFVQPGF
jgi:hypothetical protein